MYKVWEWQDNAKMAKYLRPVTLFKYHAVEYIEEATMAKDNPAFQKVVKNAKAAEQNGKILTGGELTRNAAETLKNW